MLQFIVSIIAFVVATFVGGYMGEELVIAGLLGVILVNLLLSTSMISDLKKEVAELKSMLKKDETKAEEKENKTEENKTEDK